MLEWRETEHEDDDYIVGNDPGTVNALRQCGLLKFFKIQGMRAQLRLLEYLVHMWDVDQQVFHVGSHILSLDIEDIYFLMGLSYHGSRVTLTGSRGGGLPMSEYVRRYCDPEAERRSGKVSIRDVWDLPLRRGEAVEVAGLAIIDYEAIEKNLEGLTHGCPRYLY
jgi:hypothetical protein